MKRILITALCFVSLINAADDDQKEIEFKRGGKIYKGHSLSENESDEISLIGIRHWQTMHTKWSQAKMDFITIKRTHTAIAAQSRNYQEQYVTYTLSSADDPTAIFIKYNGLEIISFDTFNTDKQSELSCNAISLLQLYTSAHAQRTCGSKNRSISED